MPRGYSLIPLAPMQTRGHGRVACVKAPNFIRLFLPGVGPRGPEVRPDDTQAKTEAVASAKRPGPPGPLTLDLPHPSLAGPENLV